MHFRQIVLVSRIRKVSEISDIYCNNLLNWIDFQVEMGDHCRLLGGVKAIWPNYLILLVFFGTRS